MPESVSIERRKMLAYLRAELELTPWEKGMNRAIARARELLEANTGAVLPNQFGNPSNPAIHVKTTAEEIWDDTAGEVDTIVSGIGTGGTLTGIARALRPRRPGLKMFAVEPAASPVLSSGNPGPQPIQGIGAGFVPEVLDVKAIDEVIQVTNEESMAGARRLAKTEGTPGGDLVRCSTCGDVDNRQAAGVAGKRIVTIIPSFAERYITTTLFEGCRRLSAGRRFQARTFDAHSMNKVKLVMPSVVAGTKRLSRQRLTSFALRLTGGADLCQQQSDGDQPQSHPEQWTDALAVIEPAD
jgi:cysteine synthase